MGISPLVDANCEVVIRDMNLEDNGEIRNLYSFEALLKLNEPSSWQIDMSTADYNLLNSGNKSFTFGDGIMFYRDNELLLAGPICLLKIHYLAGQRTTTIIGSDDKFWLSSRVCYPVVEGMILENDMYRFGKKRVGNVTIALAKHATINTSELEVANAAPFIVGETIQIYDLTRDQTVFAPENRQIQAIDYPANKLYTNTPLTHSFDPPNTYIYQSTTKIIDDPAYLGYDSRVGPAETVIKELAYYNAGEGACHDQWGSRAIPHLTIPHNYALGATVTSNTRGENLLTQIQGLGTIGGVNFDVNQEGTDLVLNVFKGEDLTLNENLIFSVAAGNLKEYEATIGLPLANMLIGVGPNPGVAKIMLPAGDPDSISQFGRFEGWEAAYQGNSGDTPVMINAAMAAANQAALLTQAYASSVALTIQETDSVRFPRDFALGDKIRTKLSEAPDVTNLAYTDQVLTNISYTVPAGSGGGAGSALTAFLKKQMTKTMLKIGQQGDLLKQILLNS